MVAARAAVVVVAAASMVVVVVAVEAARTAAVVAAAVPTAAITNPWFSSFSLLIQRPRLLRGRFFLLCRVRFLPA